MQRFSKGRMGLIAIQPEFSLTKKLFEGGIIREDARYLDHCLRGIFLSSSGGT